MKMFLGFFSLLLLLFPRTALSGVTVIPLGKNDKVISNFQFVGMVKNVNNYSGGSGTVIGDGSFVLTAKHVVTHNSQDTGMLLDSSNFVFEIDNKSYKILKVYGHPLADIAIIQIDGVYEKTAKLSFSKDFVGQEFYGVGYGKSSTNPKVNNLVWDLEYGTKHVYKNRIDAENINIKITGNNITKARIFIFDLSDPADLDKPNGAVSGEGMHGPGDSGGGLFIIEDEELHLFGIISAMTIDFPYMGFVHDVSFCREWIESIVKDAFAIPKPQVATSQNIEINIASGSLAEFLPKDDHKTMPFINEDRRRRSRFPFHEMSI